jgi:hypothetical protein
MAFSQKIINDARPYTVSTNVALLPPILATLPTIERDGATCVNMGIPKFFNATSGLWLPYAVGSGSITPALTGVENKGTSAGSVPLFLGYDTTTFIDDRYVELAKLAPGPSGSVTITSTALPANGSVLIDTAPGFGIYTFTDGGTILNHKPLVSSTSTASAFKTVGLDAGTGISLNTNMAGTDVTIASTITFQDGGATIGHIPLIATASTATTFEPVGLDAGTGISLTPVGAPNVTDVIIASTVVFQDGGTALNHVPLVANTSTATIFETIGLDAGTGISLTPLTPPNVTDVMIASTVNLSNGGVDPARISLVAAGAAPDLKTVGLVGGAGIDNPELNIVTVSTGTDVTLYGMQLRQETVLANTTGTGTATQYYAAIPYFYTGIPVMGGAMTLSYVNNLVGNAAITLNSSLTARPTCLEIELFAAFNQPYIINISIPTVWPAGGPSYPLAMVQFWHSNNTTHTINTSAPPVLANTGGPTFVMASPIGTTYQFNVGNVTFDCRMQMKFIF